MTNEIINQFDRAIDVNNKRAVKNDLIGQLTLEQFETAYTYFDGKCAYSGIPFTDRPQVSIEHIIPVVSGGHSMAFNCVPVNCNYNTSKSGYHLLDWWKTQTNDTGRSIYNPYRLLKLINYMLKCLESIGIQNADSYVLTDNETDEFLKQSYELQNGSDIKQDKSDYKKISQIEVFRKLDMLRIEDVYSLYEGLDGLKLNVAIFFEEALYELGTTIPSEILQSISVRIANLADIYIKGKKVFSNDKKTEDIEIRRAVLKWAENEKIENKYGIIGYMDFEVLKKQPDVINFLNNRKKELLSTLGANDEDFNLLVNKVPNILTSLTVNKRITALSKAFKISCDKRNEKSSEMFRYIVNKPDLVLSGENMNILIGYSNEKLPVDKRLLKKGIPITTIVDNIEVSLEILNKADIGVDEAIKQRIFEKIINNSDGRLIRQAYKDLKRRVKAHNEEYSNEQIDKDASKWIICISEKYSTSGIFKERRINKTKGLYKTMSFNDEGHMVGVNPNAYIVPDIIRLANLNLSREAESGLEEGVFSSKRIRQGQRADRIIRELAKRVLEDNPGIDEEHTIQEASRWFVFLSELSEIPLDWVFSEKSGAKYIDLTRDKYKEMKFDDKGNFIDIGIDELKKNEIGVDFMRIANSFFHARGDYYLIKGRMVPKVELQELLNNQLSKCKNKREVKSRCIQILKEFCKRGSEPIGEDKER